MSPKGPLTDETFKTTVFWPGAGARRLLCPSPASVVPLIAFTVAATLWWLHNPLPRPRYVHHLARHLI